MVRDKIWIADSTGIIKKKISVRTSWHSPKWDDCVVTCGGYRELNIVLP